MDLHSFKFHGLDIKPVVSILRSFKANVDYIFGDHAHTDRAIIIQALIQISINTGVKITVIVIVRFMCFCQAKINLALRNQIISRTNLKKAWKIARTLAEIAVNRSSGIVGGSGFLKGKDSFEWNHRIRFNACKPNFVVLPGTGNVFRIQFFFETGG